MCSRISAVSDGKGLLDDRGRVPMLIQRSSRQLGKIFYWQPPVQKTCVLLAVRDAVRWRQLGKDTKLKEMREIVATCQSKCYIKCKRNVYNECYINCKRMNIINAQSRNGNVVNIVSKHGYVYTVINLAGN